MSSSENESSNEVSSAEESEDTNINGSNSEEDEQNDSDSDEVEQSEEDAAEPKTKAERLTESLLQQYKERQGKQLYVRFPHKLPAEKEEFEQKVQALSPLIVKAHKPRQKHARFCLVDFNSTADRDAALKSIKAATKANPDYKVLVSIPRTENAEFVKELAARKLRTLENRKAKARLRRASKLALQCKNFTSTIVVLNLPKNSSTSEVRKLFPNAVDIQIRAGRGQMNGACLAAITLPSTLEARAALKQKYSLGGTTLLMRFDTERKKKQPKKRKSDEFESRATPDNSSTSPAKRAKIENKQIKRTSAIKVKAKSKTVASVKTHKLKTKK